MMSSKGIEPQSMIRFCSIVVEGDLREKNTRNSQNAINPHSHKMPSKGIEPKSIILLYPIAFEGYLVATKPHITHKMPYSHT
jgi:hypothetical protein